MIINSNANEFIDINKLPTQNDIDTHNYGLAAAITNNASSIGQGAIQKDC